MDVAIVQAIPPDVIIKVGIHYLNFKDVISMVYTCIINFLVNDTMENSLKQPLHPHVVLVLEKF